MVYLDNAATSFPKPDTVITAVTNCLTNYCANPGRSGHSLSIEAARKVFETRETVAELFHAKDSRYVIFSANCHMGTSVVRYPFSQTSPEISPLYKCGIKTIKQRASVLLPQPDGPVTRVNLPGAMSNETGGKPCPSCGY